MHSTQFVFFTVVYRKVHKYLNDDNSFGIFFISCTWWQTLPHWYTEYMNCSLYNCLCSDILLHDAPHVLCTLLSAVYPFVCCAHHHVWRQNLQCEFPVCTLVCFCHFVYLRVKKPKWNEWQSAAWSFTHKCQLPFATAFVNSHWWC